jgi:hypothetical protein
MKNHNHKIGDNHKMGGAWLVGLVSLSVSWSRSQRAIEQQNRTEHNTTRENKMEDEDEG